MYGLESLILFSINFSILFEEEIILEPKTSYIANLTIINNENETIEIFINTPLRLSEYNFSIPPRSRKEVFVFIESGQPCSSKEYWVDVYARKRVWDRRSIHLKVYAVCPEEEKQRILKRIEEEVQDKIEEFIKPYALLFFSGLSILFLTLKFGKHIPKK